VLMFIVSLTCSSAPSLKHFYWEFVIIGDFLPLLSVSETFDSHV
jgi:hypothetical protein